MSRNYIEVKPSIRRELPVFIAIFLALYFYGAFKPIVIHYIRLIALEIGIKMTFAEAQVIYVAIKKYLGMLSSIFILYRVIRTLTEKTEFTPINIRHHFGVFQRIIDSIELKGVKDYGISKNPVEMILGLSRVHVKSSDESMPHLVLKGLSPKTAKDIIEFLEINTVSSVADIIKAKEARALSSKKTEPQE